MATGNALDLGMDELETIRESIKLLHADVREVLQMAGKISVAYLAIVVERNEQRQSEVNQRVMLRLDVLEKENARLREALDSARKAFGDLRVEVRKYEANGKG